MIVTPEQDRRNQIGALLGAGLIVVALGVISWIPSGGHGLFLPLYLPLSLASGLLAYWYLRRQCVRRLRVLKRPFPEPWERILRKHVVFFNALGDQEQERFRRLTKVLLDEVRITGIKTEVDDTCRLLVAASAVIPVFGFPEWEYDRLGEVLIYPSTFGPDFKTGGGDGQDIEGMVGTGQHSGVVILSKPDLIAGFAIHGDKQNVGIHEFAHLVDKADGTVDGVPAGIPPELLQPWLSKVAEFLQGKITRRDINAYGLTNKAEFFAVVTEYFFKSPALMARKRPELYQLLERIFRQDMQSRFRLVVKSMFPHRRSRVRRNAPCPCGSGKKYKKCCRRSAG